METTSTREEIGRLETNVRSQVARLEARMETTSTREQVGRLEANVQSLKEEMKHLRHAIENKRTRAAGEDE